MIICCIEEEPSARITADQAINHSVFQDKLSLTPDTDLSPLSTAALRFSPAEEDQQADTDILRSIREECKTYGEITDCKEPFKLLYDALHCRVLFGNLLYLFILNLTKQCRG